MIDFIQSHLLLIGIPLILVSITGALAKIMPNILEQKVITAFHYMFEHGDAADDEWFLATIKWAETKYGPGTGSQKADAVVNKLISFLPIQYRLFVSENARKGAKQLFQVCFDRLEATALKEVEEHKIPATTVIVIQEKPPVP